MIEIISGIRDPVKEEVARGEEEIRSKGTYVCNSYIPFTYVGMLQRKYCGVLIDQDRI